jgi:hypothetical protein
MGKTEQEYKQNYEELGMTDEEADVAFGIMSDLYSYMDEKTDGEILKGLLEDDELTFKQKFYMAYMFGRTRDKWFEFVNISTDAR